MILTSRCYTSVQRYYLVLRCTIQPDRILIIESDETLAADEVSALEEAGYTVARGVDTRDGLRKFYEIHPDLIILARDLPVIGREDPCLRIRQASYIPIIVLGSAEDEAETLELGADAYMARPPSLIELVARVNALLRRRQKNKPHGGNHESGNGNHLPDNGDCGLDGLTRTEFRLASCLLFNSGRLLTHSQLVSEVWGGKRVGLPTLHFYIRRLQNKLKNFHISNIRGVGYCLSGDSGPALWPESL